MFGGFITMTDDELAAYEKQCIDTIRYMDPYPAAQSNARIKLRLIAEIRSYNPG